MIRKPMKAPNDPVEDTKSLRYPLLASPKFDGIRALTINNILVSSTFKPIPNRYIQKSAIGLPSNLDGELILDDGTEAGADFNETSSAVMSEAGEPDVRFHVFDYVKDNLKKPAILRQDDLMDFYNEYTDDFMTMVNPILVYNEKELLAYEKECLDDGFEGVMLRSINSPYKEGRSTLREGYLLKLKRFTDAEAVIISYEEQMENINPKALDAFGNSKRSSAQSGKVPKGALGKWIVKGINGQFKDVVFGLGTAKGITQENRIEWWKNRYDYFGKIVTYKYQQHGSVDAPRIPIFKGFRDRRDMELNYESNSN